MSVLTTLSVRLLRFAGHRFEDLSQRPSEVRRFSAIYGIPDTTSGTGISTYIDSLTPETTPM